jgi:predicted nucleic acid-binding protein
MRSPPKSPIAEKWVINASPIIALARVGQVELLAHLPEETILPQAVIKELLHAPEGDPARRVVESGLFATVPSPPSPPEILAWDLGRGETAVISFALTNPGWVAVLDDGVARRCARSFSLPIIGTLAVIILAKQYGLIDSAAQVLQTLRAHGFRLDDALIRDALAHSVGEPWSGRETE